MPLYLNISIALVVFMGLASGGMLALVLMSEKRQQTNFTIMLVLSLLLALLGGLGMVSQLPSVATSLTNALVLLVLAFALGYTLTSFSVLSPRPNRWDIKAPEKATENAANLGPASTAVILLIPGEPPQYSVWAAARRFELADDPKDVPPILLRPFYMRDLKLKYAATGKSLYRDYQEQLAKEIAARLETGFRVYTAFYSDHPTLAEAVNEAILAGVARIVLAHVRVTDPPDPVMNGDLLEGINIEGLGIALAQVGPMWVSTLLPQIYVRRVLEAVPQAAGGSEEIGLLLVGRGHGTEGDSARSRREQEISFQRKVHSALLRVGFSEQRIAAGWVRDTPNCADALQSLIDAGCKSVYWMPSSFIADGIITLYDVPAQINALAAERGVKLFPLHAWNADELVAEEIASYVRSTSSLAGGPLAGAREL